MWLSRIEMKEKMDDLRPFWHKLMLRSCKEAEETPGTTNQKDKARTGVPSRNVTKQHQMGGDDSLNMKDVPRRPLSAQELSGHFLLMDKQNEQMDGNQQSSRSKKDGGDCKGGMADGSVSSKKEVLVNSCDSNGFQPSQSLKLRKIDLPTSNRRSPEDGGKAQEGPSDLSGPVMTGNAQEGHSDLSRYNRSGNAQEPSDLSGPRMASHAQDGPSGLSGPKMGRNAQEGPSDLSGPTMSGNDANRGKHGGKDAKLSAKATVGEDFNSSCPKCKERATCDSTPSTKNPGHQDASLNDSVEVVCSQENHPDNDEYYDYIEEFLGEGTWVTIDSAQTCVDLKSGTIKTSVEVSAEDEGLAVKHEVEWVARFVSTQKQK